MGGIQFDGNSIFNGMIASIATLVTVWALGSARARLGLLNDRMTLWLLRAELERVEALAKEPSKVAAFLLTHVVICLAILGVCIAYAPIAFIDGGSKWIGPFLTVMA